MIHHPPPRRLGESLLEAYLKTLDCYDQMFVGRARNPIIWPPMNRYFENIEANPVSSGGMAISIIHVHTGSVLKLRLDPNETTDRLMEMIVDAAGVPVKQQGLFFAGKQLEPCRTLYDYKIQNGSMIHFISRLRGC
mmetsp:Transcript_6305/g.11908  ORF Transcript_6305/g.11908 Transcript_6305/m.11908 type:complete len:136 (+) Transcript_6305:1424-1831(+)